MRTKADFTAAKTRALQSWREPVILKLLEDRSAAATSGDHAAQFRDEAALRELAGQAR